MRQVVSSLPLQFHKGYPSRNFCQAVCAIEGEHPNLCLVKRYTCIFLQKNSMRLLQGEHFTRRTARTSKTLARISDKLTPLSFTTYSILVYNIEPLCFLSRAGEVFSQKPPALAASNPIIT